MAFGLGQFAEKIGGLLTDPNQQQALLSNPMFQTGMGILAAEPGQEFKGALTGLAASKTQKEADEDRQRQEQLREELQKLILSQYDMTRAGQQQMQMPGQQIRPPLIGAMNMPQQPQPGMPAGAGTPGQNSLLQQLALMNLSR